MAQQTNQERMKEITAQLEAGVQEVYSSGRYMEYLQTMAKFPRYSFRNTLLIYLQNPAATRVAGFRTWKGLGRSVKKGEKGLQILAPTPYKQTVEVTQDEDGKELPQAEKKEITITAFKPVFVFDVSQTQGRELPSLTQRLTGDVAEYQALYTALEAVSPYPITTMPIERESTNGYCNFTEQRIVLREGLSQQQSVKTAVHEIAHALMHADRDQELDKGTAEIQAESVAYIVCQHLGIDSSQYTFGYVAGWSAGKELAELQQSLTVIQRQSTEILSRLDEELEAIRERTQELAKELSPAQDREELKEPAPPTLAMDLQEVSAAIGAAPILGDELRDELPLTTISEERIAEMEVLFWAETNDPETEEWREGLTPEEEKLVDSWDDDFEQGLAKMSPASREAQVIGTLTYLDSGEVIEYTDSDKFVADYRDALDYLGPNGVRTKTTTHDIETHYRITEAGANEFGYEVDRDLYYQLAEKYGFDQPWPTDVMYYGTPEELAEYKERNSAGQRARHFQSFVGKILSNPAADLEFYSYDSQSDTFIMRHHGGPNSYIETVLTPERVADSYNFSQAIRAQFLDMSYINPQQRLFVDMDGTLAEFQPVDRLETLYEYGYFANLKPMDNVVEAVRDIHTNHPEIEVHILSSYLSDSPHALVEKNQWLDEHLPEIDAAHRIFVPCGESKADAIEDIRDTDYLLDDYTTNLSQWEPPARGVKLLNGINHTNGTWQGDRIRCDQPPEELAGKLVAAMQGHSPVRDIPPQEVGLKEDSPTHQQPEPTSPEAQQNDLPISQEPLVIQRFEYGIQTMVRVLNHGESEVYPIRIGRGELPFYIELPQGKVFLDEEQTELYTSWRVALLDRQAEMNRRTVGLPMNERLAAATAIAQMEENTLWVNKPVRQNDRSR